MNFQFHDLTEEVRNAMLEEIDFDIKSNLLYLGKDLADMGKQSYPNLLKEAVRNGNEITLANSLQGMFNATTQRRQKNGSYTDVKVRHDANTLLADGEFNRFYIRGLCSLILKEGGNQVQVYRAKSVQNPRPESEAYIGDLISASELLRDLKTNIGVDTCLGLPAGPNSGLSVERII